jgi:YidC/Oxa1 family membrane protein insertase
MKTIPSLNANIRIVLWVLFGMALLLNYQMWSREFAAPPPAPAAAHQPAPSLGGSAPTANAPPSSSGAPGTSLPSAAPAVAAASSGALAAASSTAATTATVPSVELRTDVLDLQISLLGGDLVGAKLPTYPQAKNEPNNPVQLLDDHPPVFEVQGGLAGTSGESAPTHLARFSSPTRELSLAPGQNQVTLPLTWTDGHGVTVTKTLTLHRGSYAVDVAYHIDNASGMPWSFAPYTQILRDNQPLHRSYFNPGSYGYKGPAVFDGTKFEEINTQKQTLDTPVHDGYLAALQPYFVVAIVPPATQTFRYTLQAQGNEFLLKATGPTQRVPAGGMATVQDTVFVGPKVQSLLDKVHPRLDLTADYGRLTFLAKPLFWLLDKVHDLIGNWGFGIIIVTALIKLVLYPLSEASYRSMGKMKTLAPRINNLRETYKDDREKLNRAMMDLYKKEKINPLAGCLPMLVQIPVFFAWYYVLRDSVELRQAPFVFWINDLSARDPYYVLPLIMAVAMWVQTKLNPPVGDPTQQKMMTIMPLAMSATFAFFPAGLVLYWVTNTVLGILQQWNINRRMAAATSRARR